MRSQLVNLRIFLLNLAFDFTLDDEDFKGFTRDCVHERDVPQVFVYMCYRRTFSMKSGPVEELYMILLTKERVDFRTNFVFLLLFLVTVLTYCVYFNDIHFVSFSIDSHDLCVKAWAF